MRRFILITAMLVSSVSIASTSLSKGSAQLGALNSAWKTYSTIHPKQNPNDLAMVYGGQDISSPTGSVTTIA